MPRRDPPLPELRCQQVNVRLTQREYDIVQALIFLDEGRSSATDVLREVIHHFLAKQAENEEVRMALQALEARRSAKEGKLASLRQRLQSDNDTA